MVGRYDEGGLRVGDDVFQGRNVPLEGNAAGIGQPNPDRAAAIGHRPIDCDVASVFQNHHFPIWETTLLSK
jgi:hypothetical protein